MHFARIIDRFGRRRGLQWAGIRVLANMERNRLRNRKNARLRAFQCMYRDEFLAGFELGISPLRDSIGEAKVLNI